MIWWHRLCPSRSLALTVRVCTATSHCLTTRAITCSALIRIPRYTQGRDKAMRAELRFPDPSANPYLALATMLSAALDGIDKGMQAPSPLNNVNVYHLTEEERRAMNIAELPGSFA